jgi:hypothetical protein
LTGQIGDRFAGVDLQGSDQLAVDIVERRRTSVGQGMDLQR